MPWGLENFNQEIDETKPANVRLIVHATANSAFQEISFLTEGARQDVFRRLVGFALIAYMPEEGLKEALTSLKDIFEFNIENARYQLLELPMVSTAMTTISGASESPDLIIYD